jgi:hypothetical protein
MKHSSNRFSFSHCSFNMGFTVCGSCGISTSYVCGINRSSGVFRKNEASFKTLENATTKINATYVTGTNTTTSAYSKALIKATVAKAKAVARMFHAPAKLLTLYSTFINFYIDLCNKSLEAYNK